MINYALTTKEKVKTRLGITGTDSDDLIDDLIRQVTAWIESYCGGRRFKTTTYTNETYDGKEDVRSTAHDLFLANRPITSITTLEQRSGSLSSPTWIAYTTDDYIPYLADGFIYFVAGLPIGHKNIRITYVAGYKIDFTQQDDTAFHTLPFDLTMAATQMVSRIFNTRQSYGLTSESTEGQSVSFASESEGAMTSDITSVLDSYKSFNV